MATIYALPAFVLSLGVALVAASFFARTLDRIGVRLGIPEALLGLLTALAADGPEITSVVVSLLKGAKNVGLGVVVGSNLFNLAAMLGVTVIISPGLRVRRLALGLEGAVALAVTGIAFALVLGVLNVVVATVLLLAVAVPYVVLLVRGPLVARTFPLSAAIDRDLLRALGEREHWGHHEPRQEHSLGRHGVLIGATVALIIAGATGMVESALSIAGRWQLAPGVLGLLVLGPLTSLPNAYTAIRLGRARRGAAVVSETMNSNTINLAAGVILPGLALSVVARTGGSYIDFAWLGVMNLVALAMLARRRGMSRLNGFALIAIFLAFCVVQVVRA